jgi:hypothetical protein
MMVTRLDPILIVMSVNLVLILVRRHVGLILHALAPDQVSAGGMGVRIAGAVLLGGPVIH